jgi:CubicO group peptidase (beta-lactamase class C family)
MQEELEALVAKHGVPGAVAAVWRDGELQTAAAGARNLNTGDPMTVDTAFLTGSITKVWMTTMVMTLVEEGVLSLDTPLQEYAPEVQFGADRDVAARLTFEHLVNHSSGVDSGDWFIRTRRYPDGVDDYVAALAHRPKLTEPGVVSSYNNAGWVVGEAVLRKLTGKNFHELMRERVLEPLGLARTVFSAEEAILDATAIGSFPTPDGGHEPTP